MFPEAAKDAQPMLGHFEAANSHEDTASHGTCVCHKLERFLEEHLDKSRVEPRKAILCDTGRLLKALQFVLAPLQCTVLAPAMKLCNDETSRSFYKRKNKNKLVNIFLKN